MTDPVLAKETPQGRYYTHPGRNKSVPSITNIKAIKGIDGLKYWAAKECASYSADNRAKLASLDRDEAYQLVRSAPFSGRSKKSESSRVGDIVHGWIDARIKGATIDPATYLDKEGKAQEAPLQARQMWRQFEGFEAKYHPRWIMSEFTVWSDASDYAGTADWAAYIGDMLVLGDNKTGERIYPDTALQLAALGHADYILEPDGTERPMPIFERFAILHIRPRFSRLVPVDHISDWFNAFRALRVVFDVYGKYEDKTLMYAPKIEMRAA